MTLSHSSTSEDKTTILEIYVSNKPTRNLRNSMVFYVNMDVN